MQDYLLALLVLLISAFLGKAAERELASRLVNLKDKMPRVRKCLSLVFGFLTFGLCAIALGVARLDTVLVPAGANVNDDSIVGAWYVVAWLLLLVASIGLDKYLAGKKA